MINPGTRSTKSKGCARTTERTSDNPTSTMTAVARRTCFTSVSEKIPAYFIPILERFDLTNGYPTLSFCCGRNRLTCACPGWIGPPDARTCMVFRQPVVSTKQFTTIIALEWKTFLLLPAEMTLHVYQESVSTCVFTYLIPSCKHSKKHSQSGL